MISIILLSTFLLYDGMILKKSIPKTSKKLCMESMIWLITVGQDNGEISLLHPFSGNATSLLWCLAHLADHILYKIQ